MSLGREGEIWEIHASRGIWQAVVLVRELPHGVTSLLRYLRSSGLCLETRGLLLVGAIVGGGIKREELANPLAGVAMAMALGRADGRGTWWWRWGS